MDLSTATEQIVLSKDGKTAIRYKVVGESIDLEALKREKETWEKMTEPGEKELVEMGRLMHPYYI
jgi:hypothetical protein